MVRGRGSDDETRIPRGAFFKWSGPQLWRIAMTASLLVLLVVVRKPCSDSVGKLVTDFGNGSGSAPASSVMPKPGNVDVPQKYEVINGDMTEAEMKAAMARAGLTGAGITVGSGSGSGSGSAIGAGSGSGSAIASGSGSGSAGSGSGSGSAK